MPVISRPQPTRIDDVPLPERQQAVTLSAAGPSTLQWRLADPATGATVDLTPWLNPATGLVAAEVRAREVVDLGQLTFVAAGTVADPTTGVISAVLDPTLMGGPGIYRIQLAALDPATGLPAVLNTAFVVVEPALFGTARPTGMISLAEVRLHLRDSSPGENRLLDTVQWDAAELAACLARPVHYWNDALPRLDQLMTTQNFPFRYLWLEGATACLFRLAACWYRANRLDYQAAGVSVADRAKADDYDRRADAIWDKFERSVRQQKIASNIDAGWGSVPSGYGRRW